MTKRSAPDDPDSEDELGALKEARAEFEALMEAQAEEPAVIRTVDALKFSPLVVLPRDVISIILEYAVGPQNKHECLRYEDWYTIRDATARGILPCVLHFHDHGQQDCVEVCFHRLRAFLRVRNVCYIFKDILTKIVPRFKIEEGPWRERYGFTQYGPVSYIHGLYQSHDGTMQPMEYSYLISHGRSTHTNPLIDRLKFMWHRPLLRKRIFDAMNRKADRTSEATGNAILSMQQRNNHPYSFAYPVWRKAKRPIFQRLSFAYFLVRLWRQTHPEESLLMRTLRSETHLLLRRSEIDAPAADSASETYPPQPRSVDSLLE